MIRNDQAFYETPNAQVPLNDRQSGELAPVALEQLARYQALARSWYMERHEHQGRDGWCCMVDECDETLWFVNDLDGNIYHYTDDEILALKVAHIRQIHDGETWQIKTTS
jgi:hypothetical protein